MTSMLFAPGCALMGHDRALVEKTRCFLQREYGDVTLHVSCCRSEGEIAPHTRIVNVCPGCDRRFRDTAKALRNNSLWELLADSVTFPFPNYSGVSMAINDACPTRGEDRVLRAIRQVLAKMNIALVEPENSGAHASCCGDSYYGKVPTVQVKAMMAKRAAEMPVRDVVVHCVSCIKSMHIGGKRPRFLLDLVFSQDTAIGTAEPDAWHRELDDYTAKHM